MNYITSTRLDLWLTSVKWSVRVTNTSSNRTTQTGGPFLVMAEESNDDEEQRFPEVKTSNQSNLGHGEGEGTSLADWNRALLVSQPGQFWGMWNYLYALIFY